MGSIRIGISSWADPSLVKSGRFYPADVRTASERLRYYSTRFSLTELDSTFYAFPTGRNLSLWLESTPADFRFNVKAFSLFTQHPTTFGSLPRTIREKFGDAIPNHGNLYIQRLPQDASEELWHGFAAAIRPIESAGKLGIVLFQFPPWFHLRKENLAYIATCQEKFKQYQLAIEFRTADWLNEENRENTLGFLREHGLALVCVDEPQGLKSSAPPLAEVTAPISIVRFHGRNRENWEYKGASTSQKFDYLYSEAELKEWVPKIRQMAGIAEEVHVIFKNKHEDFPMQNANQMKLLLE